jgi:uncharacterized membrane protein YhhN
MKSRSVPLLLTLAMVATGLAALWGLDQNVFWLGAVFKTLTTLLLFLVLGLIDSPMRRKVCVGLAFSLIGDLALLSSEPLWFKVGLGSFLVTHVCYILALRPVTVRSIRPVLTAVLGIAATVCTILLAYPRASAGGVAIPVAVYAGVLTVTLVTASATVGGPLRKAPWAAAGALLFYLADTAIAIKSFVPTIVLPHPVLFTTGLYWVGQYLIVAAVRIGVK